MRRVGHAGGVPLLVPPELASRDPADYRLRYQRLGLVDQAAHLAALAGDDLVAHANAMGWDLRWSILLSVGDDGEPLTLSVDVARQSRPLPLDPAGGWEREARARAALARSSGCVFDGCWLVLGHSNVTLGAAPLARALDALPALGWHIERILVWRQSIVDRGGLPPEPWMTMKLGGTVALPALGVERQAFHTPFTYLVGGGTVREWCAMLGSVARERGVELTSRDDWRDP